MERHEAEITSINQQQARAPHFPRLLSLVRRFEGYEPGQDAGTSPLPFATHTLFKVFEKITDGYLIVMLPDSSRHVFGNSIADLRCQLIISHPRTFERIIQDGSIGLGESYTEGWWSVKDDRLCDFFGIILKNRLYNYVRERPLLRLTNTLHQLLHSPQTIAGSQHCIHQHYDLSNEFFELMLDPSMTYSCGFQLREKDSLEALQQQKFQLIANKLGLERGGQLLDIGCGWGGMLIFAAQQYSGLRCTGITISEEQARWARNKIERLGLSDKIQIQVCDYRFIDRSFDFVVSIGMFEHVGRESYDKFFEAVHHNLKPDGVGLLHTIGTTDPVNVPPDPWIQKHIFPGGRLPRLEEIICCMHDAQLLTAHVDNLQPHYAITLKLWKQNVERNRHQIQAITPQFDESFFRKWNYYLEGCRANFLYGEAQLYQVLFYKSNQHAIPSHVRTLLPQVK